MPDRPTRPGKHAARHKAPSALSRAAQQVSQRLTPRLPTVGVGRTGGTIVALTGVVLAGAASTGFGGDEETTAGERTKLGLSHGNGEQASNVRADRAAQLSEASRAQARTQLSERRNHEDLPGEHSSTSRSSTAQADSLIPDNPRGMARMLMADYGWEGTVQFSCLNQLYISESNWEVDAENPTSGAYGIPQSLPPEKMAAAGADWRTNPMTQLEWGLGYIEERYGTPCSAWEFKQANNWY